MAEHSTADICKDDALSNTEIPENQIESKFAQAQIEGVLNLCKFTINTINTVAIHFGAYKWRASKK